MSTESILIIVLEALILASIISLIIYIVVSLKQIRKTEQKDYTKDVYDAVSKSMASFSGLLTASFSTISANQKDSITHMTVEVGQSLKSMSELLNSSLGSISLSQKESLATMSQNISKSLTNMNTQIGQLNALTEQKLENMRTSVSASITAMSLENTKKLDEMRATVDEKLSKTLNERISASFKEVSDGLANVMGVVNQMQNVSSQVGNLQKVLTNVKTKGIMGEVQLGNILSDILVPEQYATNVITKKGSKDAVEYAVKLPGTDKDEPVYLPIDSKFPLERYYDLQKAYDSGDQNIIKTAKTALRDQIKNEAKDINMKYLDSPHTTDFGLLFLPTESLYAEVMNLDIEGDLQKDLKIMIAGPSTTAALLNSLSMGFRTLALQKNSKRIADVLKEVKTEFDKFQATIEEAQKKISSASDTMDRLVSTRTRMLSSKLNKAEQLVDDEKENEKDDEKETAPLENI